jgi:hypothetical protein
MSLATSAGVDDDKGVPFALLGHGERFDRAVEQAHQATNVLCAGDIVPLLGSLCSREHGADELVRHVEDGVGEACFDVDQDRDQQRAPSVCSIALDLMSIR